MEGFLKDFQDQGSSNVWGGWGSGREFFFACQDEGLMGVLLVNRLWVRWESLIFCYAKRCAKIFENEYACFS